MDDATEYVRALEKELQGCDILLVHGPLSHAPKYFVGFHRRDRHPIYTYDPKLARRFPLHDQRLIDAFCQYIQKNHGHDLFVHRVPKDSPASQRARAKTAGR